MIDPYRSLVDDRIVEFRHTPLRQLYVAYGVPELAIKFVDARWASHYVTHNKLKISESLNMTWGLGAYVAPLVFPESTAIYGRVGLISAFDAHNWRVFDATDPRSLSVYKTWAQSQPVVFEELLTTVHALEANAILRNTFRERYRIDCVLFHPDQSGQRYTGLSDVWMCVSDFDSGGRLRTTFSDCLDTALFSLLIDEEFEDLGSGLSPQKSVAALIEPATLNRPNGNLARRASNLEIATAAAAQYELNGFLHYYIKP